MLHKATPQQGMNAMEQDPWIGVHSLTEFIFCPRAGLIQYEQKGLEEDNNDTQRRFDYLADWDETEIERDLKIHIRKLWFFIIVLIAVPCLLIPIINWNFGGFNLFSIFGTGILVIFWTRHLFKVISRILELIRRRNAARQALPSEPPGEFERYEVNWWSLKKVGYETIRYRESLRDPRWKLAGKPWRVLRKDSKRIPVFRLKAGERLFRQHYARMAAYCHLIEKSEGALSPYGIILYADSYNGIAIANAPRSRKTFHEGLRNSRHIVKQADAGRNPPMPANENRCKSCPIGKPFVYRSGKTETMRYGKALSVNGIEGIDNRVYHSPCGDRFWWVPPHEKAYDKGLI